MRLGINYTPWSRKNRFRTQQVIHPCRHHDTTNILWEEKQGKVDKLMFTNSLEYLVVLQVEADEPVGGRVVGGSVQVVGEVFKVVLEVVQAYYSNNSKTKKRI